MNLDRRLLKLLKFVRLQLTATVLTGILAGMFTVAQAWLLSRIINAVFLRHEDLQSVLTELAYFTFITILQALLKWASHVAGNLTAAQIKSRLRAQLMDKINRLGPAYTKGERSGEMSNTITNGVQALDAYFSQYIPQLFFSSLIPIIVLFFVFPRDLLSGVVMVVTAPIIPVFMILIGHLAQSITQKQWKSLSRMSAYFLDVLQGITTLRILGRGRAEEQKIAEVSDAFRKTTMNVLKVAFLSALVLEMAATISTAVIAVEIGLRLLYGKMLFEPALFILILAPEFYQPMRQLGARFHAGMEGIAAAERIFEILETPEPAHPKERRSLPVKSFASIRFQNVSFSFPGERRPALNDLSFNMTNNSLTALVGPSGAGKTTISQLLMGFLQPTQGAILVDDVPLSRFDPDEWKKQIAWVPQNPHLFHRTIRENILLARPSATEQEMTQAAQSARLHEFVLSLPDGYDTQIGEQGARLSGGQAQRIALARAFLKNTPLLILDEPTANLDPILEQEIQSVINTLTRNRTTLMIAHRLTTVREADQIIVLSNGQIREIGRHDELLNRQGLYAQLVQRYGGTT